MRRSILSKHAQVPVAVEQARELHQKFILQEYDLSKATDETYQHYLNNFDTYTDFTYLSGLYNALQSSWLTGDTHFLSRERLNRRMQDFDSIVRELDSAFTHDNSAQRSTPPMLAGKQYRQRILLDSKTALSWDHLPNSSISGWVNAIHGVSLSDNRALGLFCQRILPSRYSNVTPEFRSDAMALREYSLCAHNIEHYIRVLDQLGLDAGFASTSSLSPMISDALTLDPGAVGIWFKELHHFTHSLPDIIQHLHPLFENAVNYLALIITHILSSQINTTHLGMGAVVVPAGARKNPEVSWQQKPLLHHFPAGKDTVVIDIWDIITDILYDHEDKYDAGLEISALMQGDGNHFVANGYAWRTKDFHLWKKNHQEIQDLERMLL